MYITKRPRSGRCGFTVIEFLIAMTTSFIALAAVSGLSVYTARSFAAMGNYMELDKNSRHALDQMTQIIREADGVVDYSQQFVRLSFHGNTNLCFSYSPEQKVLSMINTNGVSSALLTDCTFLDFQVFQRNSVAGSYDQYPDTADESAAKIVQVTWICQKRLIGNLLNTESVQSAKIVIRKQ
jgi:Tfp pilus assembly protein PilW